jgi:hypothetical protein
MDWLMTLCIILGVFGVTAVLSLLIPKDTDPEIGRDNGDGPVIPVPDADGSVMGAGKGGGDEDLDPAGDDGDGDPSTLVN